MLRAAFTVALNGVDRVCDDIIIESNRNKISNCITFDIEYDDLMEMMSDMKKDGVDILSMSLTSYPLYNLWVPDFMDNISFHGCSLCNARVKEFNPKYSEFYSSELINTEFIRSIINEISYVNCDLDGYSLIHSKIAPQGVLSFVGSELNGSKFIMNNDEYESNDDTSYIKILRCKANNIDMSGCDLSGTVLHIRDSTVTGNFKGCKVKNVDADYSFRYHFLFNGGVIEDCTMMDNLVSYIGSFIV